MFLSKVPKCPSILARGQRLVSCTGARGGVAASRAGLSRSRRGGRAGSSSPASAGPSSQRGGRSCPPTLVPGHDGASSPAGALASPPGSSSRTGRGAASPVGARNRARGSLGRRKRSRSSCIITCKIRAKLGCATTVHAQRNVRLGEEEEVVEQLLCPEMTRWRWSSTRRRSCGSGRGTSGGCAAACPHGHVAAAAAARQLARSTPSACSVRRPVRPLRAGRVLGAPPRPRAPCAANGKQQQHVGRAPRRPSMASSSSSTSGELREDRVLRAPRAQAASSPAACSAGHVRSASNAGRAMHGVLCS